MSGTANQSHIKIESTSREGRFRVGVLLFFRDASDRVLLIKRAKSPNQGLWCGIGGKLEMSSGESPYECAVREASEEVGVSLDISDLEMRAILSEKNYQNTGHWLMFMFSIASKLSDLPRDIEEGQFGFFRISELGSLKMPNLDRRILIEKVLNDDGAALSVLRVRGSDVDRLFVEETIGYSSE